MFPISDEEVRPNRTPILTYGLIALNVVVFFLATNADLEKFGLRAGDIIAGNNLLTLITSTFLHGDFLHLLFNIWSLWIFGDNVEDDLGPVRYLMLYFGSAIAGGFAFSYFANPESIAIGASGAISGIMGAYLILHPRNQVITLLPLGFYFTTVRINAPVFIIFWFLLQFIGLSTALDTGIAYSAHIGGFIAGLVLAILLRKK